MTFAPIPASGGDKPAGFSYDALLVRGERPALVEQLQRLRFSGWVGPQEDRWVVAVPTAKRGAVAGGGRGLDALAQELARSASTLAVALSVRVDRALALALFDADGEVARYASSQAVPGLAVAPPPPGLDEEEMVPDRLADLAALGDPVALAALAGVERDEGPLGVEYAGRIASALGAPEAEEDLIELLGAELDDEDDIESERLMAVLDLFGLPRWVVASAALPRDVPGGPRAGEFLRLRAGRTGPGGRVRGWLGAPVRARRR